MIIMMLPKNKLARRPHINLISHCQSKKNNGGKTKIGSTETQWSKTQNEMLHWIEESREGIPFYKTNAE